MRAGIRLSTSTLAFSLSLCLVSPAAGAGEAVLAEIDEIDTGDLETGGFELDRDQVVRVTATDLEARERSGELTSAWILDARTRRVVWKMGDAKPVREYRGFRDYDDGVRLRAGVYEVYYATYPDHYEMDEDEGWWRHAGRALRRFAERKLLRREEYDEATENLRLAVRGSGRSLDDDELEAGRGARRAEAVVSLAPAGDDECREEGFELERDAELEIYALGEANRNERYDYGWIVDTRTRRQIWAFGYEGSERAGGSSKNRLVRRRIHLPAGRYAAFFSTDDSHSAEEWNALPPYDPAFWGLTLWATDAHDLRHVKSFQYRHLPRDRVIVELTRLRDDESKTRGFSLSEPMDVRIYAVGEGFESGMADYGWIVDARTRETLWKMEYDKTAHAGGSRKNRLVDEVVHLDAGNYLVAFVTDGSHSYRDWNSKPPARPESWGITLLLAGEGDPSKVKPYEEGGDEGILARIDKVTDGRHVTRTFTLDAARRVAIYALGEGAGGKMYDYGWLEDAESGEVVWEMRFDETEKAGGAVKNRAFRGILELPAGAYVLHYQSDDSHSFGDWNAHPPYDPESWGVRVALAHD